MTNSITIITGDCRETLKTLPAASAQCCVTSPPYWNLRDYGHADQIGQEATPDEYVTSLVQVFRAVRRVLAADGTLWLNLGDTYWKKQLVGIPWRVALALQAEGWWLRCQRARWIGQADAMKQSSCSVPRKATATMPTRSRSRSNPTARRAERRRLRVRGIRNCAAELPTMEGGRIATGERSGRCQRHHIQMLILPFIRRL